MGIIPQDRLLKNLFAGLFYMFLALDTATAQIPVETFHRETFDINEYKTFSNKKIPEVIAAQVITALSFYPELKDTKIVFKFRKVATPLSARPRLMGMFRKKKNRPYIITISNKSDSKFSPILFANLPYNAQIGVLGHELGHIFDYNTKSSWQILSLVPQLLNRKFVDQFEFGTDLICINTGLGYQLLDWSKYVRKTLKIEEWAGITTTKTSQETGSHNQRYMNPQTIINYINVNPIYRDIE